MRLLYGGWGAGLLDGGTAYVTAYVCFLLIHQPEDGHKRRNM